MQDVPMMLSALDVSGTITLGSVIIASVLGLAAVVRALLVVPTKAENANLQRQLRDCRGEADELDRICDRQKERLNELGAEKDEAVRLRAAADERAQVLQERLDAMPDWPAVKEFTEGLLEHVDKKAAERQAEIVDRFALISADMRRE